MLLFLTPNVAAVTSLANQQLHLAIELTGKKKKKKINVVLCELYTFKSQFWM